MRRSIALAVIVSAFAVSACDSVIRAVHGGAAPPNGSSVHGAATDAQAAPSARYTIDTPLGELVADAQARAIVERYVPGVTEGPHAEMAAGYSLRQIQAQMPGVISEADLNQIAAELAEIR
ncbi:MAG: hypothetical protein R3C25_10385 [Hyphomonadaceae bacterium]